MRENVESRNDHRDKHLKPHKQMSTKLTRLLKKSDNEGSVKNITSYQQLYDQVYDSNYDSDSDNYVAAISCESANQLEPLNAKVQFGEVKANAMIDSGRAVSLITKTLANQIL